MTFTNSDFVDLLNFYKIQENFPANARKSFDTFSEVSKSDDGDESKEPLIKNDNLIFDLDNMCFNSYLKENGRVKGNRPSSVDALHFVKDRIFFN